MSVVIDELNGLPERIKASADRINDLTTQINNERETRDELIVTAVDEAGIPQRQVARYAGLSPAHVIRILAQAGED